MKTDVRLNNVLFPLWMLLLFPAAWLVVLPGNFVMDSAVLLIALAALKIKITGRLYAATIWKIFLCGLAADAIGAAFLLFCAWVLQIGVYGDEWYMTIPALLIAGAALYGLDYFLAFRKYARPARFRLALIFAIATAPYTFLVPSAWLYQ